MTRSRVARRPTLTSTKNLSSINRRPTCWRLHYRSSLVKLQGGVKDRSTVSRQPLCPYVELTSPQDNPNQGDDVTTEEKQAYLDKIEKAGGRTLIPVTEIPNMMTFAQFEDPQGNRVGLVKAEAI